MGGPSYTVGGYTPAGTPLPGGYFLQNAADELDLTPQERFLYRHHLDNLVGSGKVFQPDGRVSTVLQAVVTGPDGRFYNIPTVWNGKALSPRDAMAEVRKVGLSKFPAYSSPEAADARYFRMHDFMEQDERVWRAQQNRGGSAHALPNGTLFPHDAADSGLAPPDPLDPGALDSPVAELQAVRAAGNALADWWKRGGIAGTLGLSPIDEQLANLGRNSLSRPIDVRDALHIDLSNPMLWALAPGSFTGYHGTPHTFPAEPGAPFGRFKTSAIGSGEGAQAYGWGHYIAGNLRVAESYIPGEPKLLLNGKPFNPSSYVGHVASDIFKNLHDKLGRVPTEDELLAGTNAELSDRQSRQPSQYHREETARDFGQIVKFFTSNKLEVEPGGHLLDVRVRPDEHELLDWDKPLSEQSPGVQKILQDTFGITPNAMSWSRIDPTTRAVSEPTGREIYRNMAQFRNLTGARWTDQQVSQMLHEAGIPGIKYLDAGSRATGRGTSNYVIFHPSNLEIIGRGGQKLSLTPVENDPFGASP